jgi:EpsI family protein
LVADAAEVSIVQHFALAALLQAAAYTLLGPQVTWAIAFPLAYLLFAVPVGEALIPPLQQVTAWFTVEGLRLTGIPVWWEGLHLVVPSGSFEVAEACSGLRYLIASVALGFLYAYLSYRSLWRRLAFIALSVAMPIVANGIRAYGIVMIAHLSDMKYATGIDHLIYGWLFFGLVVLLMFWIGSFWREPVNDASAITPLSLHPPLAPVPGEYARRYVVWTLAVILVAAVGPLWADWINRAERGAVSVTLQAPTAVAPWQGPEADAGDWEPKFSGADAVVRSQYLRDGRIVYLYVAYYRQQRPDAKLVSSQNSLYDGKRWRYVSEERIKAPLGKDEWPLQATLLTDGQRRRLVWSAYWEGGRLVVSPYVAKLWEAWDRLSGAHRGSALVAVAADYEVRPDEAESLLREFLASQWPGISATLQQPGGGN